MATEIELDEAVYQLRAAHGSIPADEFVRQAVREFAKKVVERADELPQWQREGDWVAIAQSALRIMGEQQQ